MEDSNNEAMISNLQTTIEKYEQANKEQIEKIVNLEEIITEMIFFILTWINYKMN